MLGKLEPEFPPGVNFKKLFMNKSQEYSGYEYEKLLNIHKD